LGDVFMRQYYTVFNYVDQTIGIAKAKKEWTKKSESRMMDQVGRSETRRCSNGNTYYMHIILKQQITTWMTLLISSYCRFVGIV
jgi:hypothetical protein